MAARPTITETIKIRISATRTQTTTRERYTDCTTFDAMHHAGQLSDRQHAAAARLYAIYRHAGLEPRATPRYCALKDDLDDEDVAETWNTPDEARAIYNALLRRSGVVFGGCLAALMGHMHPGIRWMSATQDALDWLGDEWGLEKAT